MTSNLSFLNSKNYRVYHVDLAKKLGSINAAIFLCELVYQTDKFIDREAEDKRQYLLRKNGKKWAFLTQEDVEERTAMSRKEQDVAIRICIERKLIDKIITGLPAKRYFCLNEKEILELFGLSKNVCQIDPNGQTGLTQTDKLDCPKGANSHIYKEPELKEPEGEAPPYFCFSYEGSSLIRIPFKSYKDLSDKYGEEVLRKEMEKATDYLVSTGSKGKKDYAAFMRNWMKKAQEWEKPKKESSSSPSPPQETHQFKKNHKLAINVLEAYKVAEKENKVLKDITVDGVQIVFYLSGRNEVMPLMFTEPNFEKIIYKCLKEYDLNLKE